MNRKSFTDKDKFLALWGKAAGATNKQIAQVIGCCPKVLSQNFESELDESNATLNMNMVGALYRSGMQGNVAAQIFWCKTRLGWTETSKIEHSGNITPVVNFNPKVVPPTHEHDDGEDSRDIH